jgi:ammonium transporter, Amt family
MAHVCVTLCSRADNCCGVLYGCDGRQLAAQVVFLLAILAYVSVAILIFCVCLQYLGMLRISKRAERMGIDAYDHGGNSTASSYMIRIYIYIYI